MSNTEYVRDCRDRVMIDFTEWFLEDPDRSLTLSKNRVTWTKADRSAVRYVGNEQDIANNFNHKFSVLVEEGFVEDEQNRGLIRFWELRRDWDNRVWIYARKAAFGWNIHFEQRYNGNDLWSFHGKESFFWGQRYFVNIVRKNGNYRLRVTDSKAETILIDTGDIQGINQTFQQIWIVSTIKSRRNNRNWSTGHIENLEM